MQRLEILENPCISLKSPSRLPQNTRNTQGTLYCSFLILVLQWACSTIAALPLTIWCAAACNTGVSWAVQKLRYLLQRWRVAWFKSQKQNWCLHARHIHPDATVFCISRDNFISTLYPIFLTHPNICCLPQLLTLTKSVTYVLLLLATFCVKDHLPILSFLPSSLLC